MMNKELYDILKVSVNSDGLPIMNSSQFILTTEKYGKEEFRKTLAELFQMKNHHFLSRNLVKIKLFVSFINLKNMIGQTGFLKEIKKMF